MSARTDANHAACEAAIRDGVERALMVRFLGSYPTEWRRACQPFVPHAEDAEYRLDIGAAA